MLLWLGKGILGKTTTNLIIIFPVLAGVCLAGLLLFKDFHSSPSKSADITDRELIGEVVYTDSNVKRQFTGDMMWDTIEKKIPHL